MTALLLSVLLSASEMPIVEIERPVEVAVVVLAPDVLPAGTSMSLITQHLTRRLAEHPVLRPTTLAQLGLLDPVLDRCPAARLLSCWSDEIRVATRPPRYAFVVSLRVQSESSLAARGILLPILGEGAAPDMLRREQELQAAAGHTEWVEARWPADIGATLDEVWEQLRSWLRARGELVEWAEVDLLEVPSGASIAFDEKVLPVAAGEGELALRAVPPGVHRIRVVSIEGRDWSGDVELSPGEHATVTVPLARSGLRGETVLGLSALGLGAVSAVAAVIAAGSASASACLPASGQASCPTQPVLLFGSESGGVRLGEAEGFPIVPVAVGLTTSGVASLLAPAILSETCQREPVWCQVAAFTLGAAAGAVTAGLGL